METKKESYTDLLIQYIKDAGQELIDRAEEMVDENTDLITKFSISIEFDQEFGSVPEITWHTSVITKNTVQRF